MQMQPEGLDLLPNRYEDWEHIDCYLLFGAELSYFTRKLHAALLLAPGVQFRWYNKSAHLKQDIEMRSGSPQMPILLTPENWMIGDTTPIIQLLDTRIPSTAGLFFPKNATGAVIYLMEEYFDQWMTNAAIYYRWCFPESAEYARKKLANGMAPNLADNETISGLQDIIEAWWVAGEYIFVFTNQSRGKRAVKALGCSDLKNQQKIEEEFMKIFCSLDEHLSRIYERTDNEDCVYVLDDGAPCILDTVLLGCLWAHFLQDPTPKKILEKHCPNVCKWATINLELGKTRKYPEGWPEHKKLDLEELPPFFTLVLQQFRENYMPVLKANEKALMEGKALFVADGFGSGPTTFKTRFYPEKSRRIFQRWIHSNLNVSEQVKFDNLLQQFSIDDFRLEPTSRL